MNHPNSAKVIRIVNWKGRVDKITCAANIAVKWTLNNNKQVY